SLCRAGCGDPLRGPQSRQAAPAGVQGAWGTYGGRASCTAARNRSARRRKSMSDVKERIDALVKANEVVLFMKGSALFPQCGFSSRAVAILDHLGVPFETVDVLQDQEIRTGIKEYSDWPTVPQLYVKGEFVGGSDIMMEMFESGELQQLVAAAA